MPGWPAHRLVYGLLTDLYDESAFVLAHEHGLLMHVFDVAAAGAMRAICQGEDIGTHITSDGQASDSSTP